MKKSSFKLGSLGVAGMVLVSQMPSVAFADEVNKKVFSVDASRLNQIVARAKELGVELTKKDTIKEASTVAEAKELVANSQSNLNTELDKLEKALNNYATAKDTYDSQLRAAHEKLESLKQHEGEEGHLSQTLLQNLTFASEPNAILELETNGNDVVDKEVGLSDELSVNSKSIRFVSGGKIVATYSGLENSSYNGKKISKVVYTFEKVHPENEVELNVLLDPTLGVNFNSSLPYQDIKMTATFYNENEEPIEFSEENPALIGLSSITTNQIGDDGTKFYREVIKDYNFKFIPITGSSVTEQSDGIYSMKDNKFKWAGARFDHSETDFESSPLFWYLGGAGELKASSQVELTLASTVETRTQFWSTFNSKVPTDIAIKPPTEPAFDVDLAREINTVTYEVKLHTIWVTVGGKVLKNQVEGTKDKETFNGYVYVRTEVDDDGNTKHIYDNTTKWVTVGGKELRGVEVGTKEKETFEGYSYVRTETDEHGNVTHIYDNTTKWITEKGKELRGVEVGVKEKETFEGYSYVRTETDEYGNVTHIYDNTTKWITEKGEELLPPEKGEKYKKEIPGYSFVETKRKENGDIEHVYKKNPNHTTYVDEGGKELLPKDEGILDKKDIPSYEYVRTDKKENGDVEHVYRQIKHTTTYVDVEGNVLLPPKEGIHEKETITGYEFVRTDNKPNGDVEHVYKKIPNHTTYVDEGGKELLPKDEGILEKKDIPEYDYIRTDKKDNGDVEHVYRKSVTTTYVDENGNKLLPPEKGEKEKKDIPGYKFVETKKKENGDIEHVYKQVSKITTYVDESGKELLPKKEGIHEKEKINGYEFVKTVTKENGDVEHVYKQVSKVTTYVDESGKELLPKKEGIHEKETINGYEYVKTITKDNGDVEHVYKKVTEKKLPNTSVGIFGGIAGLLGLTGVGAYFNSRKRKK